MSQEANLGHIQEILARLVGFDTTSRNANRALIDYIRDYLQSYGVASEIFASDDGRKACLWATVGAQNQSGVALAGHTDTVPVDGQKWRSDPFTLTERDGKFYARGAVDMKGFIACALAFVPEFLAAGTDGCFHLALTSDEETDMSGAQRLTDALAARGVKPQWVWVGEPTEFAIIDQHKGVAAYRTDITGVPCHSGKPDLGINAIQLAAQFIGLIDEVAQRKKQNPFAPSRFDPPYTTLNTGEIKGGAAANIVAEKCEILWEIRAHPGDSAQATAAMVTQNFSLPAKAVAHSCACYDIPPFLATPDNAGTATLKRLLKCDETHAVAFATEAGIFQKLGTGAVVCGPGSIDQAHQPDEFIDKNQLVACVDLMRAVLLSSSASLKRAARCQ